MGKAIVAGTIALVIAGTSTRQTEHQRGRRTTDSVAPQHRKTCAPSVKRAWLGSRPACADRRAGEGTGRPRAGRATSVGCAPTITAMRNAPPQGSGRAPAPARHRHGGHRRGAEEIGRRYRPLYKSLDDNQKRRFAMLSRLTGPAQGALPRRRCWPNAPPLGPAPTDGGSDEFDPSASAPLGPRFQLAAAVALPAPRHDRRRMEPPVPPGGLPFLCAHARRLTGCAPQRRFTARRDMLQVSAPVERSDARRANTHGSWPLP